jgi:hypothetical protein
MNGDLVEVEIDQTRYPDYIYRTVWDALSEDVKMLNLKIFIRE